MIQGVATPFFREVLKIDEGHPGYNYTPYQLFALETRVKNDPIYVSFNKEVGGIKLISRNFYYQKRMTVFLCLISKNGYINPPWFDKVVRYNIENLFDYITIINFNYNTEYPEWWLRSIAPCFNLNKILKESGYEYSDYPVIYKNGSFMMKLFDPTKPYNYGSWTPTEEEVLDNGEQSYNHDINYGDFTNYKDKYNTIRKMMFKELKLMYSMGVVKINDDEIIRKWKLSPYTESVNGKTDFYYPDYDIYKFNKFVGFPDLINNQMEHNSKSWFYQKIFVEIHNEIVILESDSYDDINNIIMDCEFERMSLSPEVEGTEVERTSVSPEVITQETKDEINNKNTKGKSI